MSKKIFEEKKLKPSGRKLLTEKEYSKHLIEIGLTKDEATSVAARAIEQQNKIRDTKYVAKKTSKEFY